MDSKDRSQARAVVFDFDGTIANTFPLVLRIITTHRASRGETGPTPEEIEELRGVDSRRVFEFLGIPRWKVPFVIAAVRHKLRKLEHELDAFDGMAETLDTLVSRGWLLLVLSSNGTRTIRDFFTLRRLPHPLRIEGGVKFLGKERRLRRLLRDLDLDASRVVLVGDETRDLYVGRECGTRTVGVSWGFNVRGVLEVAQPDAVVERVADLPGTLDRLLPSLDGAKG